MAREHVRESRLPYPHRQHDVASSGLDHLSQQLLPTKPERKIERDGHRVLAVLQRKIATISRVCSAAGVVLQRRCRLARLVQHSTKQLDVGAVDVLVPLRHVFGHHRPDSWQLEWELTVGRKRSRFVEACQRGMMQVQAFLTTGGKREVLGDSSEPGERTHDGVRLALCAHLSQVFRGRLPCLDEARVDVQSSHSGMGGQIAVACGGTLVDGVRIGCEPRRRPLVLTQHSNMGPHLPQCELLLERDGSEPLRPCSGAFGVVKAPCHQVRLREPGHHRRELLRLLATEQLHRTLIPSHRPDEVLAGQRGRGSQGDAATQPPCRVERVRCQIQAPLAQLGGAPEVTDGLLELSAREHKCPLLVCMAPTSIIVSDEGPQPLETALGDVELAARTCHIPSMEQRMMLHEGDAHSGVVARIGILDALSPFRDLAQPRLPAQVSSREHLRNRKNSITDAGSVRSEFSHTLYCARGKALP